MGREVRVVPSDWVHPKDENGRYKPLFGGSFEDRVAEWNEDCAEWDAGNFPDYADEEDRKLSYSEWAGEKPDPEDYMPTFPVGTATFLMMYETTSEGTPISPAFETPEELARWLSDNEASAFAGQTASYESWLRVAKGGFAVSAVLAGNELINGVDGMAV